ncbi:hypothetical protein CPC197_0404C, partial [Chlamydia psittaci C1/97]
WKKYSSHSFAY